MLPSHIETDDSDKGYGLACIFSHEKDEKILYLNKILNFKYGEKLNIDVYPEQNEYLAVNIQASHENKGDLSLKELISLMKEIIEFT